MEEMMETCDADARSARTEDGGLAFLEAKARCRNCRHAIEYGERLAFTPVSERALATPRTSSRAIGASFPELRRLFRSPTPT
jgi:hypothetical protein